MKKIIYLSMFCSLSFIPLSGEITAFSPSIPGQPLIFHTTTPTLSPVKRDIFRELSRREICDLKKLSKISQHLSEELTGLIGNVFLPLTTVQKQEIFYLYSSAINDSIYEIKRIFSSSKNQELLGDIIEGTLIQLVSITNQMLFNTAIIPNTSLFQQNYIEMQRQVINPFNASLTTSGDSIQQTYLKAEAKSALEALVSCLSLTISNTNSMVNGNNPGSRNLVLARQQILKNLIILIESAYVLQVLTSNNCG